MSNLEQAENRIRENIQNIDTNYDGLRHSELGLLGRVGLKGGYIGGPDSSPEEQQYAASVIEALSKGGSDFSQELHGALQNANGIMDDGVVDATEIMDAAGALQKVLRARGRDIGNYGANNDGVDYKWGETTTAALQQEIRESIGANATIASIVPIRDFALATTGAAALIDGKKIMVDRLNAETNQNITELGQARMTHLDNINKQLQDNGLDILSLRENPQDLSSADKPLKNFDTESLTAFREHLSKLSEKVGDAEFKNGGQQLQAAIDRRIELLERRAEYNKIGLTSEGIKLTAREFDSEIVNEIRTASVAERYTHQALQREETAIAHNNGSMNGAGSSVMQSTDIPAQPTPDPRYVQVTNQPQHNFTVAASPTRSPSIQHEFRTVGDVQDALMARLNTNRTAQDIFAGNGNRMNGLLRELQKAEALHHQGLNYVTAKGISMSYPEYREFALHAVSTILSNKDVNTSLRAADVHNSKTVEDHAAADAARAGTDRVTAEGDKDYHTEAEEAAKFEGKGENFMRRARTVFDGVVTVVDGVGRTRTTIEKHRSNRNDQRNRRN